MHPKIMQRTKSKWVPSESIPKTTELRYVYIIYSNKTFCVGMVYENPEFSRGKVIWFQLTLKSKPLLRFRFQSKLKPKCSVNMSVNIISQTFVK